MTNTKWKVSAGGRYVDSGTHPEDERATLQAILSGELGAFERVPSKSYAITCGDLTTSSYGDEFERTAGMVGDMDGEVLENVSPDGYLFGTKAEDEEPPWEGAVKSGAIGDDYATGELIDGVLKEVVRNVVRDVVVGTIGQAGIRNRADEPPILQKYHLDEASGTVWPANDLALGDTLEVDGKVFRVIEITRDTNGSMSAKVTQEPKVWDNANATPLRDFRETIRKISEEDYDPVAEDKDRAREDRAIREAAQKMGVATATSAADNEQMIRSLMVPPLGSKMIGRLEFTCAHPDSHLSWEKYMDTRCMEYHCGRCGAGARIPEIELKQAHSSIDVVRSYLDTSLRLQNEQP